MCIVQANSFHDFFSVIRISCHFKRDGKTGPFPSDTDNKKSGAMLHCQVLLAWRRKWKPLVWLRRKLIQAATTLIFLFAVTVGDTRSEELYGSPLLINMRNLMHGKMGLDDSLSLSHLETQTRICQRRMLWICWWNISHTEHITTLVKRLYICLLQVILSSSPCWIASKTSIIRLWPHHKDNMEQMIWHVRIWQHVEPPAMLLALGQH